MTYQKALWTKKPNQNNEKNPETKKGTLRTLLSEVADCEIPGTL